MKPHTKKIWQKNTKNAFLAVNWAYIGQSDNHIGWAKSMPFASIDPTQPRTNSWNFGENCSAFGGGWKTQFFWVGHFDFLLHSYLNQSQINEYQGWNKILMITLISNKKLGDYRIMRNTVKWQEFRISFRWTHLFKLVH